MLFNQAPPQFEFGKPSVGGRIDQIFDCGKSGFFKIGHRNPGTFEFARIASDDMAHRPPEAHDAERAGRVRRRALAVVERMERAYPDDPVGSALGIEEAFEDELCPALDTQMGTCDLYEARPTTCRTFGPAVRFGEESLAVCERAIGERPRAKSRRVKWK